MKTKSNCEKSIVNTLFVLIPLLFLSACGGGGGSDSSTGNTAADKVDFSEKTDAELTTMSGTAYSTGDSTATFDMSSATSIASGSPKISQFPNKLVAGFCDNEADGGSADITATATEFSYTFVNCSLENIILNGGMSIITPASIANFTHEVRINNYSFSELSTNTTFTMNGQIYLALPALTDVVQVGSVSTQGGSYTFSIVSPELTDTVILSNFENSFSRNTSDGILSSDYSYTVSSTLIGGEITIKSLTTIKHLYNTEQYPYEGTIEIKGKGDGAVLITIIDSTSINVKIDKDGDRLYESDEIISWTDFAL